MTIVRASRSIVRTNAATSGTSARPRFDHEAVLRREMFDRGDAPEFLAREVAQLETDQVAIEVFVRPEFDLVALHV